jgi:hypothetical protein
MLWCDVPLLLKRGRQVRKLWVIASVRGACWRGVGVRWRVEAVHRKLCVLDQNNLPCDTWKMIQFHSTLTIHEERCSPRMGAVPSRGSPAGGSNSGAKRWTLVTSELVVSWMYLVRFVSKDFEFPLRFQGRTTCSSMKRSLLACDGEHTFAGSWLRQSFLDLAYTAQTLAS